MDFTCLGFLLIYNLRFFVLYCIVVVEPEDTNIEQEEKS